MNEGEEYLLTENGARNKPNFAGTRTLDLVPRSFAEIPTDHRGDRRVLKQMSLSKSAARAGSETNASIYFVFASPEKNYNEPSCTTRGV